MKIMIDEQVYRELIEQSLYLQALEAEGVDNWTWYSTAIQDFIQTTVDEDSYLEDYLRALGKITEDDLLDDVDISDIAKYYSDIVIENQEEENAST